MFAVDFIPTHVNAFKPPAGARVKMNYSIAGRNTYGPGGGVQFQLAEIVEDSWFESERHLIRGGME